MNKLKKDDDVIVVAAKTRVSVEQFHGWSVMVVSAGVNMVKRHTKPNPNLGSRRHRGARASCTSLTWRSLIQRPTRLIELVSKSLKTAPKSAF